MVLEQIQQRIGGLIPGAVPKAKGALKTLTEVELMDAATVACVTGKYNLLGTHIITPQTEGQCGNGVKGVVSEQMGMFYVLLKDDQTTPVEVNGLIRVAILDAEDRVRNNGHVIHSVRTEKLAVSKTDITTGFKFAVQGIRAKAYDKIALFLRPDANVTVVLADSDIEMDTTLYG